MFGPTRRRGRPPAHGKDDSRARARRERRGANLTGLRNVGAGDGGARLAVAEGVVLREACVGGHESCLPNTEGEVEHDCGTSAYSGTYSNVRKRAPITTRMRQMGQREASCDEEEGTEPSISKRRQR